MVSANTVPCITVGTPLSNVVASTGGWSSRGKTRIYVQRKGNIFTCKCSPWGSTTYADGSTITIDLTTDSQLSVFKDRACAYGYMCYSQNASSFSDVLFTGGLNEDIVIELQNGIVYRYSNNSWSQSVGESPQSVYGYPRTVINPLTNESFEINENTVTKL